jgi:hypothetical protein
MRCTTTAEPIGDALSNVFWFKNIELKRAFMIDQSPRSTCSCNSVSSTSTPRNSTGSSTAILPGSASSSGIGSGNSTIGDVVSRSAMNDDHVDQSEARTSSCWSHS